MEKTLSYKALLNLPLPLPHPLRTPGGLGAHGSNPCTPTTKKACENRLFSFPGVSWPGRKSPSDHETDHVSSARDLGPGFVPNCRDGYRLRLDIYWDSGDAVGLGWTFRNRTLCNRAGQLSCPPSAIGAGDYQSTPSWSAACESWPSGPTLQFQGCFSGQARVLLT